MVQMLKILKNAFKKPNLICENQKWTFLKCPIPKNLPNLILKNCYHKNITLFLLIKNKPLWCYINKSQKSPS